MPRQIDRHNNEEDLNIFQAFTDLMSNAFMIISFLLLVNVVQALSISQKLKSASPIIIDEKSGNFKFPSGSAELTTDLKKYIETNIAPEIEKATKKDNIDFIQVIGHTDSQGISNASNLDGKLTSAASGKGKITDLKAGSNADLGLMRAIAVVQFLQQAKKLDEVKFRAYSAAQLYLPSGKLASQNIIADDARRRIEIRFVPRGQNR
jgi:outer membrane protein OmpA-like peptidoglycan-associated protein